MHSSDSASPAGLHHRGLPAPRWLRCGCAIASLATSASLAHPVLPEAATLDAINDARLAHGLGPLAPVPLLAAWLATARHRRNLLAPQVRHAAVVAEGRYVTFLACD
jgi:hypothetical protein